MIINKLQIVRTVARFFSNFYRSLFLKNKKKNNNKYIWLDFRFLRTTAPFFLNGHAGGKGGKCWEKIGLSHKNRAHKK